MIILHAEKFCMFLSSADFLKNKQFFRYFFQENLKSAKLSGSRSGLMI